MLFSSSEWTSEGLKTTVLHESYTLSVKLQMVSKLFFLQLPFRYIYINSVKSYLNKCCDNIMIMSFCAAVVQNDLPMHYDGSQ